MIGLAQIDGACKGNPQLRHVLKALLEQTERMANAMGVDVAPAAQATRLQRILPPPLARMTVSGQNGVFVVDIANPVSDVPLIHEIQSSPTIPFSVSNAVVTYGPSTNTQIIATSDEPTLYWRWRSRYPHSGYNVWQLVETVVPAGTIPSLKLNNLVLKYIGPDHNTLTQDGTDKTIIIETTDIKLGEESISYNAGEVNVGEYDTYVVYAADPLKEGGNVTYFATTDPQVAYGNDDNIIFGIITLSALGGGMGVDFFRPFQATTATVAGTVITIDDLSTKLVEDVIVGDTLLGIDGGIEEVIRIETILEKPCWEVTTNSGKTLQGACSHLLLCASAGGPRVLSGVWPGDRILVHDGANNLDDFVLTRTLVTGFQTVYRIITDRTKTYLADGVWVFEKGGGIEV